MHQYIIEGGQTLRGSIDVYGDKNTALKLIPSTILSEDISIIHNVPDITDIRLMMEIMQDLGTKIEKIAENSFSFDNSKINKTTIDPVKARQLRASTVLLGPMLARFGELSVPHPGGCIIGKRPVDIHMEAIEQLGAKVEIRDENYYITAKKLVGTKIVPHRISVTGTENIIMAASMAEGTTIIEYAACEPSVVSLAEFLNQRGAKISGHGSPRIVIEGVKKITGGETTIIPDRIEAGTFVILGALCGQEIIINNCFPPDLEVFLEIVRKAGVDFQRNDNQIIVKKSENLISKNIITREHPGFPTDLQPPYTLLMTQAKGLSMIHETVFEGRLNYTELLNKMGSNIIQCDPHRVIVSGPTKLYGKKIVSPDIRAGIALVIAALIAEGTSHIDNIDLVDRGYANLDQRLELLGAKLTRKKIA